MAALIGLIFFKALSRLISAPSHLPVPGKMADYAMNLKLSGQVCEQKQYPPAFAYPLPGVLFWHSFSELNFTTGAMIWLLVLPASMIGCLFLSVALTGTFIKNTYWGIGIVLAFAAAQYFLLWDLRVLNVNSFYLLSVLLGAWCWQREKLIWAGVLLALGTAIKIYSIAFLPYILFRKEWRLACVMLIAMAVFFLGVPALYFGPSETVLLTKQWLAAIHSDSRPEYMINYHAYKISLAWVAVLLLNPQASDGKYNFFNYDFHTIGVVLDLVYLIWAFLVIAYFVTNLRSDVAAERKRLAYGLDISVLLFCFFPMSVFLQPHHLVVLLVPAVCLVSVIFNRDFELKSRIVAGLTIAAGAVLTESFHNPFRGVGVMMTVMVYLAGIYIIRRRLRLCPQTSQNELTLVASLTAGG